MRSCSIIVVGLLILPFNSCEVSRIETPGRVVSPSQPLVSFPSRPATKNDIISLLRNKGGASQAIWYYPFNAVSATNQSNFDAANLFSSSTASHVEYGQ